MANDRNRMDEQYAGPGDERSSDTSEDRVRDTGIGDDVRGVADGEEEEFEDMDDLEEEDDSDSSF
jgi:hypothetical protein